MHDPDHKKTIAKLIEQFGKEDCLKIGLLGKDDETLFLTALGTGFLIDVEAAEIKTLTEAYAAGFEQGYRQAKDES